MEEKELIKGKFIKMNIPAVFCLIMTCIFGYGYYVSSTSRWAATDEVMMFQILMLVCAALTILFFLWMSGCSITVTNKRVYGIGAFRKRVDLPFDMISSVGGGLFYSIAVATSSGKIKFWFVENKNDIYNVISKCLVERQNKGVSESKINQKASQSDADELKKFKELLDSGVITQEEFETKKKQLLGM